MKKAAVIFSGGLDSAVVIANLLNQGYEVTPLVFDDDCAEFKYKTMVAVEKFLTHYQLFHRMIKVRLYDTAAITGNDKFGFIPGWKMAIQIAAMAQAQFYGIEEVYYGYNSGNFDEIYDDERPENIDAITDLYNKVYGSSIRVLSPFYHQTKADMVRLGHTLGVPMHLTVSCANIASYGLEHCGHCELCKRRIEAFEEAGLIDTGKYAPDAGRFGNDPKALTR